MQTRRDGGLAAELAGLLVYGEGVVVWTCGCCHILSMPYVDFPPW